MNKTDIAVAVYDTHTEAESAVKTLQRAGFDMKKIFHRRQGLPHRGARAGLFQYRRAREVLQQAGRVPSRQ